MNNTKEKERYSKIYDEEFEYYYPYDNHEKKTLPLTDCVARLNSQQAEIADLEDGQKTLVAEVDRLAESRKKLQAEHVKMVAEIKQLKLVNSEHGNNLVKIINYCKSSDIGKLGKSFIDELITSHEQLKAERDGALEIVKTVEDCFVTNWLTFDREEVPNSMGKLLDHTIKIALDPLISKPAKIFSLNERVKGAKFYGRKLIEMGFDGVDKTTEQVVKQLRQQAEGLE